MLYGSTLWRKGGWDERKARRGEEEEEERGSVGVAVYELGRAPPHTKRIFMGLAPRQPALSSASPARPKAPQSRAEGVRPPGTTSSTKDSSMARSTAAAVGASPISDVVNEPNFRMLCPYFWCVFWAGEPVS